MIYISSGRESRAIFYINILFMKQLHRWFTLFELLVVMGVISILMVATMNFWSHRLDQLQDEGDKEEFVSSYTQYASIPLMSNYVAGKRVSSFELDIFTWGLRWLSWVVTKFSLSWFLLDGKAVPQVSLQFLPYTLWCALSAGDFTGRELLFQFYSSHKRKSCFHVLPDTCTLVAEPCL